MQSEADLSLRIKRSKKDPDQTQDEDRDSKKEENEADDHEEDEFHYYYKHGVQVMPKGVSLPLIDSFLPPGEWVSFQPLTIPQAPSKKEDANSKEAENAPIITLKPCEDEKTANKSVDPHKVFEGSILASQMDSKIAPLIKLTSTSDNNPYEMTLGRNPIQSGSPLTLLIHGDKEQPISIKEKLAREQFELLSLHDQLTEIMSSQFLTDEQLRRRWQLATDLLLILRAEYPSCQLYVFGSLLTGLGDTSSDIDIYMDSKGDAGRWLEIRPSAKDLHIYNLQLTVHKILESAPCPHNPSQKFAEDMELIGTRIPIVRMRHPQTGVSVDISFSNPISVQNSKLLLFYMDFDPRVKPLIVFLRYWADFHGIAGSQKIKKYALVLLALVYFTRKKIIPSIHLLQTLAAAQRIQRGVSKNSEMMDGWDTSFCTDRKMIDVLFQAEPLPADYLQDAGKEFLVNLQEFLEMIVSTDLAHVVVCPLLGKMIPRKNFLEMEDVEATLPERLKEWRKGFKYLRDFCKETRILKPLVIQDPFVWDFNVAGLVDENTLDSTVEACKSTLERLKAAPKCLLDLFSHMKAQDIIKGE